jgi:hypothetical protein
LKINELKKAYEFAKEGEYLSDGERVGRKMDFIKMLMSDNSSEIINFHYDILKEREYKGLYYSIRARFDERPQAEAFLINKLSDEKDPEMLADILQILGGLKSSYAGPMAREFVNHSNEHHREVALFVLGWIGNESDIAILNEHLLNEVTPHLRSTAASAHRQIHFRLPELKDKLLASLKQGFEKETDDEVIPWIIVMIESIALKRLGLREDKEDPYIIHGDLEKAKLKTAKFLAELDLG